MFSDMLWLYFPISEYVIIFLMVFFSLFKKCIILSDNVNPKEQTLKEQVTWIEIGKCKIHY